MSEQIDDLQMSSVVENGLQSDINSDLPNLHAMGFAELLDTTFSLYRVHFWAFLCISAGSCPALLILISTFLFEDSVGSSTKVAIWIPTVVVFWGISIFVIKGLVFASAEAYLGRRIRIGAVLRQGGHRFWQCFAGSLLFALLAVLLMFISAISILVIFNLLFGDASDIVGPLFVSIIAVFVMGWSATYWCFFVAAVLVEGKTIREGIGRTSNLTSGAWWRVVGLMFAILLLYLSIGYIFRIAAGFLLNLAGFVEVMAFLQTINLSTLWQLLSTQPEASLSYILIFLINLGIDTFTTPIWVIGGTLLYFNQRIRKEGFDIEVMATRQQEGTDAKKN